MHRLATMGAAIALAAGIWLAASPSAADYHPIDEPAWVQLEGYAALPMSEPHKDLYGRGGGGGIGIYKSLVPQLALGIRLSAVVLPEEEKARTYGALGLGVLSASIRLRPFAHLWPERRATGLWLEASVGGALLEDEIRLAFDAGVGINFPAGPIAFGPMARLIHVLESAPRFAGTDRDIYIAVFGVEIAVHDYVPVEEIAEDPVRPAAY